MTEKIKEISELIILSAESKALKKAVFSKPSDKTVVKMVMTLRSIASQNVLQAEYFHTDNKAKHKNIPLSESLPALSEIAEGFSQINLITTAGDAELRVSKSGKATLLGGEKLKKALAVNNHTEVEISKNNIEKKHILNGSEEFLKLLGISDASGRIYDKKQLKFRQINRFVEMIRDIEHKLPLDKIKICDLCCGKSYLSFAVYHYFANVLGAKVTMIGVDLKEDVIEYCNDVAQKLGFSGLSFVQGDINDFFTDPEPDLVVSLHACDTATDIVLNKAMEWKAKVILSTPCCHHELNHSLNCKQLSFIAEHSMLRQKFCDAATDALRLKLLEANGYKTAALELVEDAPKNIMLRAVRIKNFDPSSPSARAAREEYDIARSFLLGTEIKTGESK